jgi:hypothetical protein
MIYVKCQNSHLRNWFFFHSAHNEENNVTLNLFGLYIKLSS